MVNGPMANLVSVGHSRFNRGGFSATYRAYSVAILGGRERTEVERGNKVIMPSSALRRLTLFSTTYPMMFRIRNVRLLRESHCGVLEFSAEEGRCLLPFWLMRLLLLNEGDLIEIISEQLSVGTFARFQPQSVDFLDISDPRAVLEQQLRNFACLSTGDVIAIEYNDR
ncbi:ubiquitin fusion-degradation protein-like [Tropilaelaps mercedesae]|uniref:Ubiquitin fusion-degradation protein-like n=1 Tax=Tropilaelaps mercedesae TaxID=418985 RepID=A0A1V9XII6_9ACAR|nr:ubiquitin fusion-degradation protein-like [Tropilaelaps mercedesae]